MNASDALEILKGIIEKNEEELIRILAEELKGPSDENPLSRVGMAFVAISIEEEGKKYEPSFPFYAGKSSLPICAMVSFEGQIGDQKFVITAQVLW